MKVLKTAAVLTLFAFSPLLVASPHQNVNENENVAQKSDDDLAASARSAAAELMLVYSNSAMQMKAAMAQLDDIGQMCSVVKSVGELTGRQVSECLSSEKVDAIKEKMSEVADAYTNLSDSFKDALAANVAPYGMSIENLMKGFSIKAMQEDVTAELKGFGDAVKTTMAEFTK